MVAVRALFLAAGLALVGPAGAAPPGAEYLLACGGAYAADGRLVGRVLGLMPGGALVEPIGGGPAVRLPARRVGPQVCDPRLGLPPRLLRQFWER